MNRKLAAGLAAIVVIALGVWFFALRGDGTKTAPPAPTKVAAPDMWGNAKVDKPAEGTQPPLEGAAPRWQLDVDPAGPLLLEGQVVDEGGDPVGGATVRLGSVPPRTATSETDGSFTFDKLVGRQYEISAVAGDKVGGPIAHRLTATSDPIKIQLVAGAKLVVAVVDGDKKPIAKATVTLTESADKPATTGDDGKATLAPVHPGWVTVRASAEGYADGSGFAQLGAAGATGQVEITLRKGFTVTGRVVDDARKPIAGAHVSLASMWDIPGGGNSADTDAKGVFVLPALAPGTYTLVASDGSHAPARSSAITIESKPVDGIEIVMQGGGVLAGTVVDTTGAAMPFATVRVSGDGQQMFLVASRQATTDAKGAFELRGLARTKLKARAQSDAAASGISVVDLTTAAEKRDLKLVLDITGTIAGIVVDTAGQPLAEVQVNAFPDFLGGGSQDAMALAGMSSATTDGGGRFVIRGLPVGEYRVRAARASGSGRYDWGQQGTAAKTGDSNVKITLAAPGSVVGRLALEDGKAPVFANVQLSSQPPQAAGKDGVFAIGEVSPGTYDLVVRGPEFAEYVAKNVIVVTGKPTDLGTLTLVRGRKVTGRVVDATGTAVSGARVRSGDMLFSLQGAEDQMANFEEMSGGKFATSDQEGRFTLIGIAKKSTSVLAEHTTKGRSNAVEIPAGTDDPPAITLTMRGFGSIAGKVTSVGKPVAGATVTATPKGGGSQVQIVQSEPDGSFTLTKVSEGVVVLGVMQQDMMSLKSTSVETKVVAGKQTTINVDIPVGAVTLTVQVKALPSNVVDSAQVFLMRGILALKNAKELTDSFIGGNAVGMKFWLGTDKPMPEFTELVPGTYSACTIPITGDLNNPTFQQRLQQNMETLAVYCKQVKVAPSPTTQTLVHEVPAMTPLPN